MPCVHTNNAPRAPVQALFKVTQGTWRLSADLQTPAPAQPHYHAVVTTSFTLQTRSKRLRASQ